MNKSELIEAMARKSGETKANASRVLDAFIGVVIDTLREDDSIVIPNFGSFSTSERAEREGRNPQTGAKIKIKASRVPKFKAGKSLKDAVKGA